MDSASSGRRSAVEGALLDFQRSPGRFALLKREPVVLFASIKDVLQVAAGRAPEGEGSTPPLPEVRQAARFFVRSAMLHQSADHYTLLGVDKATGPEVIKDRYRQMMRLMHPDFAPPGEGTGWPPDTAARVNRAYETLSTSQSRKDYDEGMSRPLSSAPPAPFGGYRGAAANTRAADPRGRLKILAAATGALGTLLAGVILFGGSDRESLVQRQSEQPESPALAKVAVQEPKVAARRSPRVEAPPQRVAVAAAVPQPSPAPKPVPALVSRTLAPLVARLDRAELFVPKVATAPAVVKASAGSTVPTLKLAAVVSPAPARPMAPVVAVIAPPAASVAPMPPTTSAPPVAVAVPVALVEQPRPAPKPNPGVTLFQVHPLLAELVQQIESGVGDQLLTQLDRDARRGAPAQALVRQYNSLVEGGTVKVSHVQFRSEPQEGRLLVTGYLMMDVRPPNSSTAGKELVLQAEFVSRNGAAVMTGLSRAAAGRAR